MVGGDTAVLSLVSVELVVIVIVLHNKLSGIRSGHGSLGVPGVLVYGSRGQKLTTRTLTPEHPDP